MKPDHRQFDLFAPPPAQLDLLASAAPAALATVAPSPVDEDDDEGESPMPNWPDDARGDELRADWHARRDFRRAERRAEAAGQQETLAWGAGLKPRNGYWWAMPFGKPGLIIRLWEVEPGRWIKATSTSRVNGGGLSGFWHNDKGHPTREAALLAAMRTQLKYCAGRQAMKDWGDGESAKEAKAAEQLADWAIAQCPPLVYGVDLADEYRDLCAAAREEELRRRAMLSRLGALWDATDAALRAADNYTDRMYRTVRDTSIADWQASFVGEYHITGTMPDQLEMVVYDRRCDEPTGLVEPDAFMQRIRDLLAAAVDIPVRFARPEEHRLCKTDRERVTW